MKLLEAKKQLLSCPGDTIQETIDALGMSQAELAERMGRSVPKLNELIKGKAPITTDTAIKLSRILGPSSQFWLNLEAAYQSEVAEIKRLTQEKESIEWLKNFPLPKLKQLKIISDTKNKSQIVDELLRFFRIGGWNEWDSIYNNVSISFKIALKNTTNSGAITVWLRMGELEVENLDLQPYDKSKIRSALSEIHDLSVQESQNWRITLQSICARCGLALVYTPMIKNAPISGAARWIKNGSIPLIQISSRYKNYHAFWFHFYHELAHILFDGNKNISLKEKDNKTLSNIEENPEKEAVANKWAEKKLISQAQRNELFNLSSFSRERIMTFSKKHNIHYGIVIGQLARQELIKYNSPLIRLIPKVSF